MQEIAPKISLAEILRTKDEIAKLLGESPEMLRQFEKECTRLEEVASNDDTLFSLNAKQASGMVQKPAVDVSTEDIIDRIVLELVDQTPVTTIKSDGILDIGFMNSDHLYEPVSNEEILALPKELRPQLTGKLMKVDIDEPSYPAVLSFYAEYLKEPNTERGRQAYNMFRQGLDIMDLDPVLYRIINQNRNSASWWMEPLSIAIKGQSFFRVPETKIAQIPLPLLQLTRCEYGSLTPTTLAIVDRFCQKVFSLDQKKEYFVKTGTYSSKYDFRNCHVYGEKEVKEIGEYLLFIHFQALQMASPLSNPTIVGASTTCEWVVREFIPDKENAPTIYHGMPLHTEYRVFADMDTCRVIGMNPYWDPEVMKKRFGHSSDSNTPDKIHDYIIFKMWEGKMMEKYRKNADMVREKIEEMLPAFGLKGQWSIDVMQNGDDFYIIDMALAANSALVECIPKELLKPVQETWIPPRIWTDEEKITFMNEILKEIELEEKN